MAINLPGPYEVDYIIQVSGFEHHLRLNCIALGSPTPGDAPGTIELATKSGGTIDLQTAVDDVWDLLRAAYNTSVVTGTVTLWRYVTGTYQKDFITSLTTTNAAGTTSGATRLAGQVVMSLRSGAGGWLKLTALETAETSDNQIPLVAAPGISVWSNLAMYFLSASGWAIARDDSFPIAPLTVAFGENEAIYRKRFRS